MTDQEKIDLVITYGGLREDYAFAQTEEPSGSLAERAKRQLDLHAQRKNATRRLLAVLLNREPSPTELADAL